MEDNKGIDPKNSNEEELNPQDPKKTEEEKKAEQEKLEKQKKEEDAKQAKLRHERDMLKAKAAGDAEGYKRARIKSVNGVNPYTETPISTDEEYELFEIQDEIKRNGGDPKNVAEVEKVRFAQLRKIKEEKNNQEKANEEINKQVDDAIAKYGKEKVNKIYKDPTFQMFADGKLGNPDKPLISIIEQFEKFIGDVELEKGKKARQTASPGSANTGSDPTPQVKSISKMNKEEFESYRRKVASGKIKIE